jgi:hypothetical protein
MNTKSSSERLCAIGGTIGYVRNSSQAGKAIRGCVTVLPAPEHNRSISITYLLKNLTLAFVLYSAVRFRLPFQ